MHVTLFLCGDVMTGRGIDQILPHPGDPALHEPCIASAAEYVLLAEKVNGPIPRFADPSYVWGNMRQELDSRAPDARIINLETAITKSDEYWCEKEIHYRMHPQNVGCLLSAGVECCSLANNHVLDWGYAGLSETLSVLANANIQACGAGEDLRRAILPVILPLGGKGRVLVFACGSPSSGIPPSWAAGEERPGVHLVSERSPASILRLQQATQANRQEGDLVIVSVHWGANWEPLVPQQQRRMAHALIDEAGVDVVYGHSSHHVKGIEVHHGRPVLYGCGDFLDDYEGIGGHQEFRPDLGLMYFVSMHAASGTIAGLEMVPTRVRRFQLTRAHRADEEWLRTTLSESGKEFGTSVERSTDDVLRLCWN